MGLCPKTYCAYDADYEVKESDPYKLGRKGIPHRNGYSTVKRTVLSGE